VHNFIVGFNRWSESRPFQAFHWVLMLGGTGLCLWQATRTVGIVMLAAFGTEVFGVAIFMLASGYTKRRD
jgi:hypothetical protein